MAKVINPLHSATASGSVGATVCYTPVGVQRAREIPRTINGEEVVAQYPTRIVSGRGIVRAKPRGAKDFKRSKPRARTARTTAEQQRRDRFAWISQLAHWVVRENIAIGPDDPALMPQPQPPWWDSVYFLRGVNREIVRFPGQPEGTSVSIRRFYSRPLTPHGYVFRQLYTRGSFRLETTMAAWEQLPPEYQARWQFGGTAPVESLPVPGNIGDGFVYSPGFANALMQVAYLSPRFALSKNWLREGQQNQLWKTPFARGPGDQVVGAWVVHISSAFDTEVIQLHPWERRNDI